MAPSKSTKATAVLKQAKISFKSTKPAASTAGTNGQKTPKSVPVKRGSEDEHVLVVEEPAEKVNKLKTLEMSGRLKKPFGEAKIKMGAVTPIHADSQTKVHHILRTFDLSYEYGPCVGVTRLERWERAEALGLDPPQAVREILLTEEGAKQSEYSESVFYGEV